MEQNINIAVLLKDCPKGTKLYSSWCGNCQFQFINSRGQIIVFADEMNDLEIPITFEEKGNQFQSGECLLFPSKDNRDWSMFKAPQKELPKFKVGDAVKCIKSANLYQITDESTFDIKYKVSLGNIIARRDKFTLATPEEIAKWNKETLEPNHLHYSKSKRKIIDWFKEFDKVLVRNRETDPWLPRLFSKHSNTSYAYGTQDGLRYSMCLPYNEKTAKLMGTTNDYEED